MREKKRYVAFEVKSEKKLSSQAIEKNILHAFSHYAGLIGQARAGIQFMRKLCDEHKGVIRVTPKFTDALKASFVFVTQIDGVTACVWSTITSGSLAKVS